MLLGAALGLVAAWLKRWSLRARLYALRLQLWMAWRRRGLGLAARTAAGA